MALRGFVTTNPSTPVVHNSSTPWVVTFPTGVQIGDIVYVQFQNDAFFSQALFTPTAPTTPTGWTSDASGFVYHRVFDGSEGASVSFAWTGSNGAIGDSMICSAWTTTSATQSQAATINLAADTIAFASVGHAVGVHPYESITFMRCRDNATTGLDMQLTIGPGTSTQIAKIDSSGYWQCGSNPDPTTWTNRGSTGLSLWELPWPDETNFPAETYTLGTPDMTGAAGLRRFFGTVAIPSNPQSSAGLLLPPSHMNLKVNPHKVAASQLEGL